MSLVKDEPGNDPHVLALFDAVMGRFRQIVATEDWDGLRASHFRVLGHVPGGGITITDLAERLGMTKQGCSQFVSGMVDLGLLRTTQDPDDGRVRVVTLTSAGRLMNERFERRVAQVEQEWADAVGSRRYATFRAVLAQLPGTDG